MIRTLGEVLDVALRAAGLETAGDLVRVTRVWREAVGGRIAQHAEPVGLARGELCVAVADPVWRQELALLTPEIARGVNRNVGEELVRRVRLIGGGVHPPDPKPVRRRLRLARQAPDEPEPASQPPTTIDLPEAIAQKIAGLVRARADRVIRDRR